MHCHFIIYTIISDMAIHVVIQRRCPKIGASDHGIGAT